MSTVSEVSAHIATAGVLIALFYFAGTAIVKEIETPDPCASSVIRIDKINSGSSSSCEEGAVALKPEKVKVDDEDVMIVRCQCKPPEENLEETGIDTETISQETLDGAIESGEKVIEEAYIE